MQSSVPSLVGKHYWFMRSRALLTGEHGCRTRKAAGICKTTDTWLNVGQTHIQVVWRVISS